MSRKKKSRKIGLIGVRKSPDFKREEKEKRLKKPLGKPAGSRNNQVKSAKDGTGSKTNKDPRLGSKIPVDLFADAKPGQKTTIKKRYFSPEQELAQIENDEKLIGLVGRLDAGETLSKTEQLYVDTSLSRHKTLCDILGIQDSSEDQDVSRNKQDDDVLATFEKMNINQLKSF